MKPTYRHTQRGSLMIVIMAISSLFFVPAAFHTLYALIPLGLIGLAGMTFSSLTTEVYSDRIRVWFGPGWVHKEISLEDVKDVRAVRNVWYYGWGIRYIGNGWMFNVSGLDAVELALVSGKRFRIGTNEPEALEEAIWVQLPDLEGSA